jgi:hypothetical protein
MTVTSIDIDPPAVEKVLHPEARALCGSEVSYDPILCRGIGRSYGPQPAARISANFPRF